LKKRKRKGTERKEQKLKEIAKRARTQLIS
jgi:hypothetical protein